MKKWNCASFDYGEPWAVGMVRCVRSSLISKARWATFWDAALTWTAMRFPITETGNVWVWPSTIFLQGLASRTFLRCQCRFGNVYGLTLAGRVFQVRS